MYVVGLKDDVDSPSFNIYTTSIITEKNGCTHIVRVSGKGVKDKFDLECNNDFNNNNEFTSLSTDEYVVYINRNQKLALFTDTPSTLIVFKGDTRFKRTYTTSGKVTKFTEAPMTRPECDRQLQKMEETIEEWARKFNEDMAKKFPPCFPFCNKKQAADGSEAAKLPPIKHKPSEDGENGKDYDDFETTETDIFSDEDWS